MIWAVLICALGWCKLFWSFLRRRQAEGTVKPRMNTNGHEIERLIFVQQLIHASTAGLALQHKNAHRFIIRTTMRESLRRLRKLSAAFGVHALACSGDRGGLGLDTLKRGHQTQRWPSSILHPLLVAAMPGCAALC